MLTTGRLMVCLSMVMLTACAKQPAEADKPGVSGSAAEQSVPPAQQNTIRMAAALTAMTVTCGSSKASDVDKALKGMQREMATQGVQAGDTQTLFRKAYDVAKSKAEAVDAAKRERDCALLKQMRDPASVRELEALAAKAKSAAAR